MSSREERPGSWRTDVDRSSGADAAEADPILERMQSSRAGTDPRQDPRSPHRDESTFEIPGAAEASRDLGPARPAGPPSRPETRTGSLRHDVPPGAVRQGSPTVARPPDVEDARPAPRRRPGLRRVKRTLRHVDPISIFKLSLFFSVCLLVVWLLFVAGVYWIADSRGFFDGIEDLSEGLALGWQQDITLFYVERWAFLIGFTVAVVSSLVTLFLAFLYNVAADFLGGAEMTFVERDT